MEKPLLGVISFGSFIEFIRYFISVWKAFVLFFKNKGMKFNKDKVQLCN